MQRFECQKYYELIILSVLKLRSHMFYFLKSKSHMFQATRFKGK
jgi:hypothetical protein